MGEYSKLDRKASTLITKVQNRINSKGAYENAGQDEQRLFEDMVNSSDLTYPEKYQLKQMFISRVDNLHY
jgi:hypothetical protein